MKSCVNLNSAILKCKTVIPSADIGEPSAVFSLTVVGKGKGKGINLIQPHPLPCRYSVVLYNLTPSRELTQPWCESSP